MVCLHDVSSGLSVHVVVHCFSARSAAFFISIGLHRVSFGLGVPGVVRCCYVVSCVGSGLARPPLVPMFCMIFMMERSSLDASSLHTPRTQPLIQL